MNIYNQVLFVLLILGWSSSTSIDLPINQPSIGEEIAADFTVVTTAGEIISLSDYRGKVVYISFWASWCGPCIKGFIKYESMRKNLENMGVVLLNVSIDKTETKWKTSLARVPIVGINTFANQNIDELKRNYQLSSIPAYFIVNKKGKFAYLSEKPNRNIMDEFRKIINDDN